MSLALEIGVERGIFEGLLQHWNRECVFSSRAEHQPEPGHEIGLFGRCTKCCEQQRLLLSQPCGGACRSARLHHQVGRSHGLGLRLQTGHCCAREAHTRSATHQPVLLRGSVLQTVRTRLRHPNRKGQRRDIGFLAHRCFNRRSDAELAAIFEGLMRL